MLKTLNFIRKLNNSNIVSIIDFEIPCYFSNKIDDINIIIGQVKENTKDHQPL